MTLFFYHNTNAFCALVLKESQIFFSGARGKVPEFIKPCMPAYYEFKRCKLYFHSTSDVVVNRV